MYWRANTVSGAIASAMATAKTATKERKAEDIFFLQRTDERAGCYCLAIYSTPSKRHWNEKTRTNTESSDTTLSGWRRQPHPFEKKNVRRSQKSLMCH
jgi:ribosomal silencing factor RsfS